MKNFFIFLCIFTLLFIAFLDASERYTELEISSSTPSQVQIKKPINKREVEAHNLEQNKTPFNQSNQGLNRNQTKQTLQDSINNMNRRQQSKQQH